MKADGSPGVRVDARAGAKVPYLAAIGWGGIGGGTLMLVAAAAMFGFGIRTPRTPGATTRVEPATPAVA